MRSHYIRHVLIGSICVLIAGVLWFAETPLTAIAQNQSAQEVQERREALRKELANLESQIQQQRSLLQEKQQERVSLERDVAILEAQIEKARLSVQARDIAIQRLTESIRAKEAKIGSLNSKLEREKNSLAQLIRRTNEIDDLTLAEVMLGHGDLSDVFQMLNTLATLKGALRESFYEIEDTKDITRQEQEELIAEREEERELRRLQELEKQRIEEREQEKQQILAETRGEEQRYQEIIQTKQKTAAEIRSELFTLRDSAAIPFGEALELARQAGAVTGVRPALILAVFEQESNLGENVGTGTWTADMHPTRDRPVFEAMARELGFNPDEMPVSAQPSYGWGGAMGPAQFIPSTWVCYGGFINTKTGDCNNSARSLSWDAFWQGPWEYRASEDRIRNQLGLDRPANPWQNLDAFTAAATLLAENGADQGGRDAEWLAAMRYFAGWRESYPSHISFYGDSVISLAREHQERIDILAQGD